jgi:hypothetical protein
MSSTRKIALITGVFFIITFLASIPPAFAFYTPVLNDVHYVLGGGADTRVYVGALLEVILAIAGIGTAVTLFPSSRGRTKVSPSVTSPRASLNPPSSWSALSRCWRSSRCDRTSREVPVPMPLRS